MLSIYGILGIIFAVILLIFFCLCLTTNKTVYGVIAIVCTIISVIFGVIDGSIIEKEKKTVKPIIVRTVDTPYIDTIIIIKNDIADTVYTYTFNENDII